MSEHTIRKCDECGALRTVVNHWWCVVGSNTAPTFTTFEFAEKTFQPFDWRLDYCSHKCVGSAFHRWLDTGDVHLVPLKEEAAQ